MRKYRKAATTTTTTRHEDPSLKNDEADYVEIEEFAVNDPTPDEVWGASKSNQKAVVQPKCRMCVPPISTNQRLKIALLVCCFVSLGLLSGTGYLLYVTQSDNGQTGTRDMLIVNEGNYSSFRNQNEARPNAPDSNVEHSRNEHVSKKECMRGWVKEANSCYVFSKLQGTFAEAVNLSVKTLICCTVKHCINLHGAILLFSVFDPAQNANIAEREQFPLRLAYGLTIHKAQGMTLERVKIDCREIFKPGQLAVAMSRATSATGIQVINFHRRYVMKPSRVVTEFLDSPSLDILPDARDCCSRSLSTDNDDGDDNLPQHESISIDSSQVPNDNEIDLARQEMETQELWEPEEDFETVIEAIVTTEGHLDDLDIPDELMKDIEEHIVVKKVFTTSHKNMNEVVSRMDRLFLNIFVKKLLVKLKNFAKLLSDDNMPITSGIPEKVINEFQRQVHVYSTGTEYRLNCMLLFEQESITDEHYIICYKILECVKLFFLKQKVNLISSSSSKIPQRFITDSSKARIRYVAGYCISKLRKKYQARQKSMLFSKSPEGQNSYSNSKNIVHILSLLKEDEQFLKENTTDPESLIDVESRQQLSHGLTNVTDQLYQFFITLTNESLQVMGNENFIKYGKNLFTHCQKNICENKKLSELFINLVCSRNGEENLQEFDNENQSNQTQPVLLNSNVMKVFEEVVNIYLTILLAQFRKDVKSAYKIEKKNGSQKTD